MTRPNSIDSTHTSIDAERTGSGSRPGNGSGPVDPSPVSARSGMGPVTQDGLHRTGTLSMPLQTFLSEVNTASPVKDQQRYPQTPVVSKFFEDISSPQSSRRFPNQGYSGNDNGDFLPFYPPRHSSDTANRPSIVEHNDEDTIEVDPNQTGYVENNDNNFGATPASSVHEMPPKDRLRSRLAALGTSIRTYPPFTEAPARLAAFLKSFGRDVEAAPTGASATNRASEFLGRINLKNAALPEILTGSERGKEIRQEMLDDMRKSADRLGGYTRQTAAGAFNATKATAAATATAGAAGTRRAMKSLARSSAGIAVKDAWRDVKKPLRARNNGPLAKEPQLQRLMNRQFELKEKFKWQEEPVTSAMQRADSAIQDRIDRLTHTDMRLGADLEHFDSMESLQGWLDYNVKKGRKLDKQVIVRVKPGDLEQQRDIWMNARVRNNKDHAGIVHCEITNATHGAAVKHAPYTFTRSAADQAEQSPPTLERALLRAANAHNVMRDTGMRLGEDVEYFEDVDDFAVWAQRQVDGQKVFTMQALVELPGSQADNESVFMAASVRVAGGTCSIVAQVGSDAHKDAVAKLEQAFSTQQNPGSFKIKTDVGFQQQAGYDEPYPDAALAIAARHNAHHARLDGLHNNRGIFNPNKPLPPLQAPGPTLDRTAAALDKPLPALPLRVTKSASAPTGNVRPRQSLYRKTRDDYKTLGRELRTALKDVIADLKRPFVLPAAMRAYRDGIVNGDGKLTPATMQADAAMFEHLVKVENQRHAGEPDAHLATFDGVEGLQDFIDFCTAYPDFKFNQGVLLTINVPSRTLALPDGDAALLPEYVPIVVHADVRSSGGKTSVVISSAQGEAIVQHLLTGAPRTGKHAFPIAVIKQDIPEALCAPVPLAFENAHRARVDPTVKDSIDHGHEMMAGESTPQIFSASSKSLPQGASSRYMDMRADLAARALEQVGGWPHLAPRVREAAKSLKETIKAGMTGKPETTTAALQGEGNTPKEPSRKGKAVARESDDTRSSTTSRPPSPIESASVDSEAGEGSNATPATLPEPASGSNTSPLKKIKSTIRKAVSVARQAARSDNTVKRRDIRAYLAEVRAHGNAELDANTMRRDAAMLKSLVDAENDRNKDEAFSHLEVFDGVAGLKKYIQENVAGPGIEFNQGVLLKIPLPDDPPGQAPIVVHADVRSFEGQTSVVISSAQGKAIHRHLLSDEAKEGKHPFRLHVFHQEISEARFAPLPLAFENARRARNDADLKAEIKAEHERMASVTGKQKVFTNQFWSLPSGSLSRYADMRTDLAERALQLAQEATHLPAKFQKTANDVKETTLRNYRSEVNAAADAPLTLATLNADHAVLEHLIKAENETSRTPHGMADLAVCRGVQKLEQAVHALADGADKLWHDLLLQLDVPTASLALPTGVTLSAEEAARGHVTPITTYADVQLDDGVTTVVIATAQGDAVRKHLADCRIESDTLRIHILNQQIGPAQLAPVQLAFETAATARTESSALRREIDNALWKLRTDTPAVSVDPHSGKSFVAATSQLSFALTASSPNKYQGMRRAIAKAAAELATPGPAPVTAIGRKLKDKVKSIKPPALGGNLNRLAATASKKTATLTSQMRDKAGQLTSGRKQSTPPENPPDRKGKRAEKPVDITLPSTIDDQAHASSPTAPPIPERSSRRRNLDDYRTLQSSIAGSSSTPMESGTQASGTPRAAIEKYQAEVTRHGKNALDENTMRRDAEMLPHLVNTYNKLAAGKKKPASPLVAYDSVAALQNAVAPRNAKGHSFQQRALLHIDIPAGSVAPHAATGATVPVPVYADVRCDKGICTTVITSAHADAVRTSLKAQAGATSATFRMSVLAQHNPAATHAPVPLAFENADIALVAKSEMRKEIDGQHDILRTAGSAANVFNVFLKDATATIATRAGTYQNRRIELANITLSHAQSTSRRQEAEPTETPPLSDTRKSKMAKTIATLQAYCEEARTAEEAALTLDTMQADAEIFDQLLLARNKRDKDIPGARLESLASLEALAVYIKEKGIAGEDFHQPALLHLQLPTRALGGVAGNAPADDFSTIVVYADIRCIDAEASVVVTTSHGAAVQQYFKDTGYAALFAVIDQPIEQARFAPVPLAFENARNALPSGKTALNKLTRVEIDRLHTLSRTGIPKPVEMQKSGITLKSVPGKYQGLRTQLGKLALKHAEEKHQDA